MKWMAAIGISVFFLVLLFGLFQYQAHNRKWGLEVSLWAVGVVLLVGMGLRFKSVLLPLWLGGGFLLAYLVGWCWLDVKIRGWRRHLARVLAFTLCLGPWAAIPGTKFGEFGDWLARWAEMSSKDVMRHVAYGLPGLVLVGTLAFAASLASELAAGSWLPSRREKWLMVLPLAILALTLNWYAAGTLDIHTATEAGNTRWIRYIALSRPGSVDALDTCGWTPLATAAQEASLPSVNALLEAGADPNAKARQGCTPLHLMTERLNNSPLDARKDASRKAIIKALILAGANVDAMDIGGQTPLHYSAAYGQAAMARALLAAGADVNARDHDGQTPLHCATADAVYWDSATVLVLLQAGADVNATDLEGKTPLDRSRTRQPDFRPNEEREHYAVEALLEEHGAKLARELDAAKTVPAPQPTPEPAKSEPGQ